MQLSEVRQKGLSNDFSFSLVSKLVLWNKIELLMIMKFMYINAFHHVENARVCSKTLIIWCYKFSQKQRSNISHIELLLGFESCVKTWIVNTTIDQSADLCKYSRRNPFSSIDNFISPETTITLSLRLSGKEDLTDLTLPWP